MPDTRHKLRDPARLTALRRSQILATGTNEVFDTLTRIVAGVLDVPISILCVIDNEREHIKGATGLSRQIRNDPPPDLFCATIVASGQPLVVDDARNHPPGKSSETMKILDIGAFIGVPLLTSGDEALGALAAISHRSRKWRTSDIALLNDLASLGRAELERRMAETQTRTVKAELAAERALSLRFQAHLLNTVQQAVVATDPEGIIIFWNGFAETLYGWVAEDALGHHVSELVISEDGTSHWAEVKRKMAEGKPWTRERMLKRKDGTIFHALTTLSPMLDPFGQHEGIVGVSIDLTNQKNLEEQIRQSQKMEAVGRLTGGIAHDFNNLLTVIRLNADLVLEQLHPSQATTEDVKLIRDSANRAASLTRQLLAFSRRQILDARPIDVNEIAIDLQPILARLIGDGVEVALELAAKGCVVADAGQLDQILLNLAVNSRDAMPEGGRITIRTENVILDGKYPNGPVPEMPGNYIMLAVSDTGIGMTEEIRSRAFDAFFTTKPAGLGTGLGLSTVYGIVQQSAGYIHIYSEPGLGTTVRIYFPKVEEEAAEAIQCTVSATSPHRGHETILVVEDEAGVRSLAKRILKDRGYDIIEAASGREAMRLATESPKSIDLVLTDIVMPEMPGNDLAERLSAVRTGTRFVFMSGYTKSDLIGRGLIAPNVPFLHKPFTSDDLANTIRDALDSSDSAGPPSDIAPVLAGFEMD
jgi:two-component system cell cycle sensor histidine kinase/response regulator CckA